MAEKDRDDMKTTKGRPTKEEVLHKKGTFLALMADMGSFFLCRATQDVAQGESRQFKLNWLSITEPLNTYKLDYMDKAITESILTDVKMDRVAHNVFHLSATEETRIKAQLNRTLKYLAGKEIEEVFQEENQSDDLLNEGPDAESKAHVAPEEEMLFIEAVMDSELEEDGASSSDMFPALKTSSSVTNSNGNQDTYVKEGREDIRTFLKDLRRHLVKTG